MEAADVLDRARGLNAALPIARLWRVLRLYRTWIDAGGGGLSVSPHELAAALELPSERDASVEFLVRTFAVEPAPGQLRVDLVTLLTTAAVLSQGSLEDKATLVFSLVDLDTEDDIAEHELALVVATCSDGLARLGVVERREQVAETDAVAIAYEAFAFVGIDVGDKMSFSAFMKWLSFHPRPQALFDRLSCIFSMCDLAKQMQRALQSHERLADEDPVRYYQWVHLKASRDHLESIHVVTGPVVGRVTESTVNILLEVDRDVVLKCFAFPHVGTATKSADIRVQECLLTAFEPLVIVMSGLSPGTTYIFRLLGVCRSDREQCVASVSTFPLQCSSDDASSDASKRIDRRLTLKLVNHLDQTDASRFSNDEPGERHAAPTVVVHYGLRILQSRIAGVLQHLHSQHGQNQEAFAATIGDLLKECFRGIFVHAGMTSLFRSSSNYFMDSSADILGELEPSVILDTPRCRLLQTLTHRAWEMYFGALWGQPDEDVRAFDLAGIAVLIHCKSVTAGTAVDVAAAAAAQIASVVKNLPLVSNVVIATDTPLIPDPTQSTQVAFDEAISSTCAAQWTLLQALVELSKVELDMRLHLAAFSHCGGYQTLINVKDTKVSINQLVCGPSNNVFNVRMASLHERNRGKITSGAVTLQHSQLEFRPHVGQIAFSYEVKKSTKVRLTAAGSGRMMLSCSPFDHQPELTLGPIVGFVSHSSAKIMVEASDDVEVDCVLTGRLIGDTKVVRRCVRANQPTIFTFEELRPGSLYDVSFPGMASIEDGAIVQTHFSRSPAFRLVIISDDAALDGSIFEWIAASSAHSFLHDVSGNVLDPAIDLQADLVLHLGCIASMTQIFSSVLESWRAQAPGIEHSEDLVQAVRDCVRRHWNLRANRELFSRGSHWFSSVGVIRSLLTRYDVPREILRVVCNVLADYEQVGSGCASGTLPAEQIAFRLQRGVVLLGLDTMQAVMTSDKTNHFGQFSGTLVSALQWEALEYWLGGDLSTDIDAEVNTFVITSDIGLVNIGDIAHSSEKSTLPLPPVASSWSEHPRDLLRLLGLIFRRLHSSPISCVLFVASGPTSACYTVREVSSSLTFQHIEVGPVSQAAARVSSTAPYREPIRIGDGYVIETHPAQERTEDSSRCHYSAVDIVPHPLGSEVFVRHYADSQASANIVVGPVIGRVTTRTARILIELDRQVERLLCVLVDSASSQRLELFVCISSEGEGVIRSDVLTFMRDDRITTETSVKAFDPTVLKVEGLRPGTRYRVEFEGIMKGDENDTDPIYVSTPPLYPLTTDWLVVNHNVPSEFIAKPTDPSEFANDSSSCWNQIMTRGMRAYTAQAGAVTSHRNGDSLGNHSDAFHPRFNPWHHIHDEIMSDPMTSPQLLLHLGGQVDMRQAFADDELVALVQRVAPLQALGGGLTDKQVDSELDRVRRYMRHRMQEVYRVYWGTPLMKTALGQASNFMFLDIAVDVFFTSAASLRGILVKNEVPGAMKLDEAALQCTASLLQGVAFELWQLYQNQLWTDLLERDLEFGNRSSLNKLASSSTFGLTRLVFMNVNPEVHGYCSKMEVSKRTKDSENQFSMAGADDGRPDTSVDPVSLFSTATWKVLEEVASNTTTESNTSKQKTGPSKLAIQQLVVVLSADLVEWGGTNTYPELRPQIIRLLETVLAWKLRESERRDVTMIGRSTNGSSMSYTITDEKTNEKVRLLVVGSVSQPRELIKTAKRTAVGSAVPKTSSPMKGHFSKRFTYCTAMSVAAATGKSGSAKASNEPVPGSTRSPQLADYPAVFRSFASFQNLTDLRRGFLDDNLHFFPPKVSPKVTVGPVLGRMTMYYVSSVIPSTTEGDSTITEKEPSPEDTPPEQATCFIALPLLLEVNASARVTCIVADALAYQEIRVTEELTANEPHIFVIPSLLPERRFVYRFEGVANADTHRGSFHTPPPSTSPAPINFICTSSNFPDHLDGSTDNLWAPIRERVALPWSGIDFVVHVGGQVPLQEAVVECIEWVSRKLKQKRRRRMLTIASVDIQDEVVRLRGQVRKRMQQHYRCAWNLPNVQEVLSNCSNWFLRSQADVAPFYDMDGFGDSPGDTSVTATTRQAVQIVFEEAKRVVADYQLALMREVPVGDGERAASITAAVVTVTSDGEKKKEGYSVAPPPQDDHELKSNQSDPQEDQPLHVTAPSLTEEPVDTEDCTAQLVQHGNAAFFVCDMRSARPNDMVTCNGRLQKPLTQQEHAIIGERQWQLLETALKVKKTHAFVLLLELPLILTSAEQVDKMREEQRPRSQQGEHGSEWSLYDLLRLTQHWVSCRRQLEQLLHVLFRWKLKRRGRDVLVVSGAMRIGIDSLVRDVQSGLSLRCVSVGPITAQVEPFTLPTSGIACPEFLPKTAASASGKPKKTSDSRFSFTHSTLIAKRNYVLAQVAVQHENSNHLEDADEDDEHNDANSSRSALLNAIFVSALDADPVQNPEGVAIAPSAHPVDMYRRPPSWWKRYIPMGRSVFWDDTVSLRAASDDELQGLSSFIEADRALASALEVCYDKYQFAEAARLEELRSAHARQRMDLTASLRRVFTELWRLVPDQKRRRMAYILDPYVSELLMDHIRTSDAAMASFLDGGAVEFNAFARLCRSVLWSACLLRLSVTLYEEDQAKQARERWHHRRQQKEEASSQQSASTESTPTPEMTKEARKLDKLERKRAERLREAEEELAIADEQQRLNRLADSRVAADAEEFARASSALEARVRALDEAKKQREAEREMRSERKQRKLEAPDGDAAKKKTKKEKPHA